MTTKTVRPIGKQGGRIVTALERAWAAIQAQCPDVPPVIVVTGSGSHQKGTPDGYRLRGHHWPERWVIDAKAGKYAPELFVAGETLGLGSSKIMEVLLHEAAHALAAARGIKDTSSEGHKYHNRRYADLAMELGLQPPQRPDKIIGFSACEITRDTEKRYATRIRALSAVELPYLAEGPIGNDDQEDDGQGDEGEGKPKRPRAGKREAIECACPRRIQVTPKVREGGAIICGTCGQEFKPPTAE